MAPRFCEAILKWAPRPSCRVNPWVVGPMRDLNGERRGGPAAQHPTRIREYIAGVVVVWPPTLTMMSAPASTTCGTRRPSTNTRVTVVAA